MVRQKVPKLCFQSQFSMSKIDIIFSKKNHWVVVGASFLVLFFTSFARKKAVTRLMKDNFGPKPRNFNWVTGISTDSFLGHRKVSWSKKIQMWSTAISLKFENHKLCSEPQISFQKKYPYYSAMNMYLRWRPHLLLTYSKVEGFFELAYITLPYPLCSVPGPFCHHDEAFRVASLTLLQPPYSGLK